VGLGVGLGCLDSSQRPPAPDLDLTCACHFIMHRLLICSFRMKDSCASDACMLGRQESFEFRVGWIISFVYDPLNTSFGIVDDSLRLMS